MLRIGLDRDNGKDCGARQLRSDRLRNGGWHASLPLDRVSRLFASTTVARRKPRDKERSTQPRSLQERECVGASAERPAGFSGLSASSHHYVGVGGAARVTQISGLADFTNSLSRL